MSSPFSKSEKPQQTPRDRPGKAPGSRTELCAPPIIKGLIGGRDRVNIRVNRK